MEYFLAIGDAVPCEPWSFGGCAGSVAARTADPLLEVASASLGLESWLCCVQSLLRAITAVVHGGLVAITGACSQNQSPYQRGPCRLDSEDGGLSSRGGTQHSKLQACTLSSPIMHLHIYSIYIYIYIYICISLLLLLLRALRDPKVSPRRTPSPAVTPMVGAQEDRSAWPL